MAIVSRIGIMLLCLVQASQAQFVQRYPPLPTDAIKEVSFLDGTVGFFSNAAGSIFRTTNGGMQWVRCAHYQGDAISLIRFADPSYGFGASPPAGLWLDKVTCVSTVNGGQWWTPIDVNLSDAEDFILLSRSLLLKTNHFGIQRLDNLFGSWTTPYSMPMFIDDDVGSSFGSVHQITAVTGGHLLALASYGNARRAGLVKDSVSLLLRSTDTGTTWDTLWQGSMLLMQTLAFATPSVGWMAGEHESIFKTVDSGKQWTVQRIDSTSKSTMQKVLALDTLLAVAVNGTGTFFRTTDGGISWSKTIIENTWESKTTLSFPSLSRGFYGGTELYATTDGGTTWQPVNPRKRDQTYHIQFLNARTGWITGDSAFYASTDGGYSWSARTTLSSNPRISHFAMIDSLTGWAVSQNKRLKTTDGGYTWSSTDLGANVAYARGVHFYNRNLGVIYEVRDTFTDSASCLVTSDGGETWQKRTITNIDVPSSWFKMKFTDPRHLWFANQQGLWLSRDTARTWTVYDSLSTFNSAFDFADSLTGYCDNFPRTFGLTSDGGRSWTLFDKPYPNQTLDLAIIDPRYPQLWPALMVGMEGAIFEYQEGYGVRSLDSYTLNTLQRISIFREGNITHVWILSSSFQVLYNSYIVNDVPRARSANPVTFLLDQNYPNPFNPSTTIRYGLPHRSRVTLTLYNTLGQHVATLVSGEVDAGYHEVKFDGSNLASGVYFYRLKAGDYLQTKRLLMLR